MSSLPTNEAALSESYLQLVGSWAATGVSQRLSVHVWRWFGSVGSEIHDKGSKVVLPLMYRVLLSGACAPFSFESKWEELFGTHPLPVPKVKATFRLPCYLQCCTTYWILLLIVVCSMQLFNPFILQCEVRLSCFLVLESTTVQLIVVYSSI